MNSEQFKLNSELLIKTTTVFYSMLTANLNMCLER